MRLHELIRGPDRPTRVQQLQRRRRMLALAVVAAAALVLGMLVGTGDDDRAPRTAGVVPAVALRDRLRPATGASRDWLGFERRSEESAAIDRALARTPFVRLAGGQHRSIALTFDDGPGPYTGRLLDELTRLGIPATFFVVGYQLPAFGAMLRREVALGMPVGDHTLRHASLRGMPAAAQRTEIAGMARALMAGGAPLPRLFRPPYGAYDRTTHTLLGRRGMLSVLWSVDSEDYTTPGVRAIVRNVVDRARPGAIVLMHDGGGDRRQTIAALAPIARRLRARGYRFVTVPRLLFENPPPADQALPPGFNSSGAG